MGKEANAKASIFSTEQTTVHWYNAPIKELTEVQSDCEYGRALHCILREARKVRFVVMTHYI